MIAVLTDPAIGGTFLTWTLYYLSGKTEYFSSRKQCIIDLPCNPLNHNNAHKFVVNQPGNIEEFDLFLPMLINTEESMYMHQFKRDTLPAVEKLTKHARKNIVVALTKDQVLYNQTYKPRAIRISWETDNFLSDPDEIYHDFVKHFFNESAAKWQSENLNNIWDKREFIALNVDPFDHDSILNYIDCSVSRYCVNPMELWTKFDHAVIDLFDYLQLSIDQSRYQQWIPIYNQWKTIHQTNVMFVWYFNTIVDCILQGIDFDLKRFELDVVQEAAIQHVLIYNHNLNFKTWQLDKFVNTKQLHELLEPNIHSLNPRRLTS